MSNLLYHLPEKAQKRRFFMVIHDYVLGFLIRNLKKDGLVLVVNPKKLFK